MSLNQFIKNVRKPWLNVRCEDLTIDGDLTLNGNAGQEIDGNITWQADSGEFGDIIAAYKAIVIGNQVNLYLAGITFNPSGNTFATTTDFPASLVPSSGDLNASIVTINGVNNNFGRLELVGGQLQLSQYNPTTPEFIPFSMSIDGGCESINVSYLLTQ